MEYAILTESDMEDIIFSFWDRITYDFLVFMELI
jgi:hypothetical protein